MSGTGSGDLILWYRGSRVDEAPEPPELVIQLVALPEGRTGVRADAMMAWLAPIPAADDIPATAKVLELTVVWEARPNRPAERLVSTTVTEAAKVSAIVAAINKMALLQPGAVSEGCPPGYQAVATFTFLESTAGPVVATARMSAASKTERTCYPLTLTLPALGKSVLLQNGSIVELAEQTLGELIYTPEERPTDP